VILASVGTSYWGLVDARQNRSNSVCPADNTPVCKVLADTYKVTLNSNAVLLVVSSSVISSADVVSSFSAQTSRSWVESVSRSRSRRVTYKTSLRISFHSGREPEYAVAECSPLRLCTQPALVSSALWLAYENVTWIRDRNI